MAPEKARCGGDGGDCFLTTAVVERRGIEADGGPTLTALRRFRDGYMMKTPKRRAMVAEYYEIAPGIVAAIPETHSDWDWIGGRIDAAIAAIAAGDEDGAFGIYAAMVRRLAACWTEPGRPRGRRRITPPKEHGYDTEFQPLSLAVASIMMAALMASS